MSDNIVGEYVRYGGPGLAWLQAVVRPTGCISKFSETTLKIAYISSLAIMPIATSKLYEIVRRIENTFWKAQSQYFVKKLQWDFKRKSSLVFSQCSCHAVTLYGWAFVRRKTTNKFFSSSVFTESLVTEWGWGCIRDQTKEEENTSEGEHGVACERPHASKRVANVDYYFSPSPPSLSTIFRCTFEERLTLTEHGWQSHRALAGLISMAL